MSASLMRHFEPGFGLAAAGVLFGVCLSGLVGSGGLYIVLESAGRAAAARGPSGNGTHPATAQTLRWHARPHGARSSGQPQHLAQEIKWEGCLKALPISRFAFFCPVAGQFLPSLQKCIIRLVDSFRVAMPIIIGPPNCFIPSSNQATR